MSKEERTKENDSKHPPLQKGAIAAFIIFFIVGFFMALPCLCAEGSVAGLYKSIFYLIVIFRLLYGLIKRNLKISDFLLWIGGFLVFCIIAERLIH